MKRIFKNTVAGIHSIQLNSGVITLLPGNNEVSEDQLSELMKHPTIIDRINSGKYVVIAPDVTTVEAKEEEKKNGASDGLSGYSVKKAQEIIKETFDLNLLKKWDEEDSRKKVSSAIKEQIKEINSRGEKKDDSN